MFTVVIKSVSIITLLVTMIIGTSNERSTISESRVEIPDIRSDIRVSPIDGKYVPSEMNYQGYLISTFDTSAVNDTLKMTFELFTQETGGNVFWSENYNAVIVRDGIFNVLLGSITSLDIAYFNGDPLWLQTTVEGEVLMPRKKIVTTPYSFRAQIADTADFVINGAPDNDWKIIDNVLFPSAQYGISMYGNKLWGNQSNTHVNLGVACTTGTSGQNYYYCTVGGGGLNTSSSSYSTVSGGYGNTSSGNYSIVGGGRYNTSSGSYSTVGGGCYNTSSNFYSTVGGGKYNTCSGVNSSTIGGGCYNTSSGITSTIPGGVYVNVSGDFSFGFGRGVYADTINVADDYDIVFGDGGTYDYQFGINRENPFYPLHIGTNSSNGNGARLTAGGVWTNGCSRTFKENFTKPDPDKILELVKKLDIFRYNYKGDAGVYHISPVAEDFYDLFKTGNDNRYLAGMDVSGVALLAIKALTKENEEILLIVENNSVEIVLLNTRIENLTQENQELNGNFANLTSENQELRNDNEEMRNEIDQMRADIEMLKRLNI